MVGVRRFLGRRYGWKSIGGIPSTRYNPSFHLDFYRLYHYYSLERTGKSLWDTEMSVF